MRAQERKGANRSGVAYSVLLPVKVFERDATGFQLPDHTFLYTSTDKVVYRLDTFEKDI